MTLNEYKKQKMQDPEFVKAYEEIQPEMSVIRAMIGAFRRKAEHKHEKGDLSCKSRQSQ